METRSAIPIKRGTVAYSKGAEVIIVSWAWNDEPVQIQEAPTTDLIYAVERADEIWAHNATFDRTVLDTTDWWVAPHDKWRCTAALCRMHGLPGGLDKLSTIFKLGDEAKFKSGKAHIQLFCVPNKDGGYNDKTTHPVEWADFLAYAGQDVTAMRTVYKKCPKWNATPRMWALWHLDQRMNLRGVAMDLELCAGAVKATTKAKKRMADWTEDQTLGVVERTTQRARLLAYMEGFGVTLPNLKADTIEKRLNDESLPEHIKELLRVRQQAVKSSTAKYQRVLNQHVEGRLCDLLLFCGAMRTGRWAGRTIQPQNLPRPKHKRWEIDLAIELFRNDGIELYDPDAVMGLASSCLRGMIVAAPKRKLVVADLANIEGRDMAWIAGEEWKLKAFADFDAGTGPDLYKVAYARAFNINANEIGDDDWRRQIGKVMELALQYYGGVGAFCSMAETYRLNLNSLAYAAWPVIPRQVMIRARDAFEKAKKRKKTYGLSDKVYLVCQSLVLMWRDAHPTIVKFWYKLDECVKAAIRSDSRVFQAGKVAIDRVGNWLRVRLPSGRYLLYPAPRVDYEGNNTSFVGVNPYSKQWGRISTYSGKLAENIVQASSADILMDGLLAADAQGYNPVLTVHDELICEPEDSDEFDDKKLSQIMISNSPWARGMPLAAKGFTAMRYRK